jgi:hypothetical protein
MRSALLLGEAGLFQWRDEFAAGRVPGSSPYGVDVIEGLGYEILVPSERPLGRVGTKVRDVVEHRSGVRVERALRGLPAARRADVVVALLEQYAVVPAWFKRHRLAPYRRPPLIALTCWLADDARRGTREDRERLRRRMAAVDLVVYLSRNQTEILLDLGLREEQLLAVPFGIEEDFYTPPAPEAVRDIDILAVGQDRGRDYTTRFDAVAGTELEATVVCKPDNVRGLNPPGNVRVLAPVPMLEYRALLRRSRVVAVPTHELSYPTGQSVAMEAAASGCCVVVTGTTPMREYFVDGETAFLPEVGSAESFRAGLRDALGSESRRLDVARAGRDLVLAEYTTKRMWERIFKHAEAIGLM